MQSNEKSPGKGRKRVEPLSIALRAPDKRECRRGRERSTAVLRLIRPMTPPQHNGDRGRYRRPTARRIPPNRPMVPCARASSIAFSMKRKANPFSAFFVTSRRKNEIRRDPAFARKRRSLPHPGGRSLSRSRQAKEPRKNNFTFAAWATSAAVKLFLRGS